MKYIYTHTHTYRHTLTDTCLCAHTHIHVNFCKNKKYICTNSVLKNFKKNIGTLISDNDSGEKKEGEREREFAKFMMTTY